MDCFVFESNVTNVYYNLALEHAMAESISGDSAILFLWQNADTVVIGKHQNPYKECNLAAMRKDNISLARRPSGGGAVFHDKANLNFSFIYTKKDYELARNYKIIVNALASLGINTEISGRNDILCKGKKFSGNAFYTVNQAWVHHGTIMVGVDTSAIAAYLNVSKLKLASKGVASVSSRVANLSSILPNLTVDKVKEAIKAAFLACHNQEKALEPTIDTARVQAIAHSIEQPCYLMGAKYNFEQQATFRFPFGEVALTINEDNRIEIYSDFLNIDIISYAKERLAKKVPLELKEEFSIEEREVIEKITELAKELKYGV